MQVDGNLVEMLLKHPSLDGKETRVTAVGINLFNLVISQQSFYASSEYRRTILHTMPNEQSVRVRAFMGAMNDGEFH